MYTENIVEYQCASILMMINHDRAEKVNAKKKIIRAKRNKSSDYKKIRESSSEKSSDYDCDESRDKLGKIVDSLSPTLTRKLNNLQMSAGRQRAYSSEVDMINNIGHSIKKSEE